MRCAVYETVKKKEAEKRRDAAAISEPRFADVLKQQWDDEHEHGYLDERDIELLVDAEGRAALVGPVRFHCGQ